MYNRRAFLKAVGAGAAAAALAREGWPALAADAPAGAAWSFAVVADPHLREDRAGEAAGVDKFRKVLARLEALAPRPEFLLIAGDIHPEKLQVLLPEIKIPLHVVAGNHESRAHREQLRRMFPDDFQGKDFYTFTHKDSLFIGLCTAAAGDHVGHFESQDITPAVGQGEWLEEQLKGAVKFQRTFVYGHIPPEAQNRPNAMCLAQNDSRAFQELVRRHRPAALFFGHRHTQAWFDIEGVPLYGLRSCNWNSGGQAAGFLHVTVRPAGVEAVFVE